MLIALALAPQSFALPGEVTTVAGDGADQADGDGGPATAASIGKPAGVAWTSAGLFITHNTAHLVRRVDGSGNISTFAGGGPNRPGNGGDATDADLEDSVEGIVRDTYGNVFFSERHRIRMVSSFGFIDTVVGTGSAGYSGDGGPADEARIDRPHGIAGDLDFGGYFADCQRHVVRYVSWFGEIDTVAGTGTAGYSGDGAAADAAQLRCPTDVALDPLSGDLYISDRDNNVIRRVDSSGEITTVAGTGTAGYSGDGSPATAAQLRKPHGLAFDGDGRLFIADADNHAIRRVDTGGTIGTIAGDGTPGFSGDGGPAAVARFDEPHYLDFDRATGDLYVSDTKNHRVRRLEAVGMPDVPSTVNIDSAPPSPGSDSTPTWEFSISPPEDVRYECRLTGGSLWLAVWGRCDSPKTYDLSSQPVGSYTFEVRAVTHAGTGAPSTNTYLYGVPSPLDHFELDPIGDQTSGEAFDVTVRAKTADGATDTSFNGTVDFSSGAGTVTPTTSDPFVNGVLTQSVTLNGAYAANATITATAAGPTGTSAPFALHDHVYYLKQTTAHTASGCGPADLLRDMEEGYAGQDPEEVFTRDPDEKDVVDFCSPGLSAPLTLDAGTTTAYAYARNSGLLGCQLTATLRVNGTTALGSASRTIPGFSPVTLYAWTIDRPGASLATGDKLDLRFEQAAGPACAQTYIHYGGTTNRSRLELLSGTVAPTITGGPGATGSDTTPSWSFTGEPGASFECRLEDGTGTPLAGYDWAACTSPRNYDLDGAPDGAYAFAVRQTVGGATTSPPAYSDYVLDTTPPPAPTIDSSPPSPSSETDVSWSFSGDAGNSLECRLSKGATVVSDYATCSGSQAYTLADGDGVYTFEVRQVDPAGNAGPADARDYTLDTSAPAAPTFDSQPPSPGNDPTPTWEFSGETGALLECRLTRGATVVSDWTTGCSSPRAYDLSGEPDGSYTFEVSQTDLAGNGSPVASSDYELDRGVPAAPSIDADPGAAGFDDTPSWEFSGEAGAAFECRLEDGAGAPVASYDWGSCSSPATFDLSDESDGDYTFLVRQSDAAGNTSAAATSDYTLDRGVPAAPSIDSAPSSPGDDAFPEWAFSGEPGGAFECRLTGEAGIVSDWTLCLSPRAYDLSAQPDGDYTFSVRQRDAAGNTSSATTSDYELDTAAPAAPSIDSGPASPGSDRTPEWELSGEAGASFLCRLEDGTGAAVAGYDWGPCASPARYDLTLHPDGSYSFVVRQVDPAGNMSAPTTSGYVLDATSPGAPSIDPRPPSPGADATPSWSFSGEAGGSFECRLARGGTPVSDWSGCSSPKSFDLSDEPDGDYDFSVRQLDAAGNAGPAADDAYTLDRASPATPVITDGPGARGNATNPSWSFTGEAGAELQCRLARGATVVSGWSTCTSPHDVDLSGEPDGAYTFSVRAVDAAGNASPAATDDYELDRVAPAAPTFTETPPPVGNDPTPSWSFEAESGALVECRLERGATTVADWTLCMSPASYDLTDSPDGEFRLLVRAIDGAGNVGVAAQSDYELDRTPPAAPTIDSGPGEAGSSRTPAWSFSGDSDAVHECRLSRGGQPLADWAPCADEAAYDLAGEPDGSYDFGVRSRDEAGNTGPDAGATYRLDTTGADVAIESSPGPIGNGAHPSWSFTGEPGARYECRLEGPGGLLSDWGDCESPQSYDLSSVPDGAYTFAVRARDDLDNLGAEAAYVYELDRTAPAAPQFTLMPPALGNDGSPRWEFTAENGAVVDCGLERDAASIVPPEPCAQARGYDLSSDGDYAIAVRATDRAGNAGPIARSSYRFDATAPDAPEIISGPGARGTRLRVSWAYRGEAEAAFECRLQRGPAILEGWSACTSPFRFDLAGGRAGNHSFRVRASDQAGNVGPSTRSDYELLEREGAPTDDGDPPRGDDEPPRSDDGADDAPADAPASSPSDPPAVDPPAGDVPEAQTASEGGQTGGGDTKGSAGRGDADRGASGGERGKASEDPAATANGPRGAERSDASTGTGLGERVLKPLGAAARWVGRNLDKTGFPLGLLFLVLGYLAVQNRLDRRDPKLALAPLHADRDLDFLPPPTLLPGIGANLLPDPIA